MALVYGKRSKLNPNAPLFIPAAVRRVEDFSAEWWELVTTSTWFHDYWIRQQGLSEEDQDMVQLLPDSIDFGVDEEILNMESQFEEFLRASESDHGIKDVKGVQETGFSKKWGCIDQKGPGLPDGAQIA